MNYTLKNIPHEVYEKIKQNALLNGRSINQEIIMLMKKAKEEK